MPLLRRLVTSSAVPVVLAALAAVAACSNGSSGDDSPGGGGTGMTVGTGTFCQAETAWVQRCGTPAQACNADLVTNCAAITPEMNPALLDAARDCLESDTSCSATPTGCLAGAALTAAPTAAQQQVRTDYCTKCQASGSDDCEQVFFTSDGPVSQVSTEIVPYSDAVAAQIDACTAGAGCASSFVACAEMAILTALQGAATDSTATCVVAAFKAPTSGGGDDDTDASTGTDGSPGSTSDASPFSDGGGAADGSADAGGGDGGNNTGTCGDTYEPDNTSDTAFKLPELDDSAGTATIMAAIAVAGSDDDWYTYLGNDAFNDTTSADPYAAVSSLAPMEVCVWAKETGGYSIPVTSSPCKAGTLTPFPTPGLGYNIGCCSSSTAQIYNYGRFGDDDSSTIMMRVNQMTSTLTCTDYSLTYAFKN